MIVILFQSQGHIQKCFALRVNIQLAVHDPGSVGAVLNGVPDVAVAGDNGISLRLQVLCSIPELIPALSTGANCFFNNSGIVRTPDIRSDRTAIDECAAGCLIGKTNDFSVAGTDINGILCNLSVLDHVVDIDAKIFVGCSKAAGVALSVLYNELRLGAIDIGSISASFSKSLLKNGLIAVTCIPNGSSHFIFVSKVRMQFHIAVDHAGNFFSKRV